MNEPRTPITSRNKGNLEARSVQFHYLAGYARKSGIA